MATATSEANLRSYRTLVVTLTIYFALGICLKDDFGFFGFKFLADYPQKIPRPWFFWLAKQVETN
jgi:hypothetical protein